VVLGVVNAVVVVLLLSVVLAVVSGSGCCILAVDAAAVSRFGCFCCCGQLFWLLLLLQLVVLAVFAAAVGRSGNLRAIILAVVDVTVDGWLIPVVAVLSLDDCCWCGSCSCCSGRLFSLYMLLLRRSLTVAVTIVVLFVFLM